MATEEEKRKRFRYLQLKSKAGIKSDTASLVQPIAGDVTASAYSSGEQLTEAQKGFRSESILSQAASGLGKIGYSLPGLKQVYDLVTKGQLPELPKMPPARQFPGFGTAEETKYNIEKTPRELEDEATFKAYEEASKGSLPAGIGELVGDVGLMAVPGSKLSKVKKLKPIVKGLLGGAGSGTLHQAQRVQEGKEISPVSFLAETGTGLLPGGTKLAGKLLKGKGEDIIQTALKASGKVKGKKVMDKEQIKTFFDKYSTFFGGARGSEKILKKEKALLGSEYDNIVNELGKGKNINLSEAMDAAKTRINRRVKALQISGTERDKIFKKLDEFGKDLEPFLKGDKLGFKAAQKFKTNILNPASKWDKPDVLGKVDPTLIAPAKAARTLKGQISKKMGREVPELVDINKRFGKMASVRPFIEQSAERARANRGLSLQDMLGFAALTVSTAGTYPLLKAAPFILSRAQKSPALAKALYKTGSGAQKFGGQLTTPLGFAGMQTGRSLLNQRLQ